MSQTIQIEIVLTEELLGTASANPELYREFIANKSPDPDGEVESLPDVDEELEKSMTVFRRDGDGCPILYDYQIKGFFKDACSMLKRVKEKTKTQTTEVDGETVKKKVVVRDGTTSSDIAAYKKIIDGLVFVFPRQIRLILPEGGEIGICERPLRAQTAKGERISLARSETVPAGTIIRFEVLLLDPDYLDALEEWLDYGKFRGLGQWRNSGKGRFEYSIETK